MGMDLLGAGLSYNWTAWQWLVHRLEIWGVDVSELSFTNDGRWISKETCVAIADAIEKHLDELTDEEQDWLDSHIAAWRYCNGCSQY